MQLPQPVAEAFRFGRLTLQPSWQPFEDAALQAPTTGGLYALRLPQGIAYDHGVSCIAYIGSAANFRRRLMQHVRNPHNWQIAELRRVFGELQLSWWPLPPMEKIWRSTIEGEAICRFERQFGSIPVCNLSVPESPHARQLRDMVAIAVCEADNPLTLDQLVGMLKAFRIRPRFKPGLIRHSITANEWFYNEVARPTPEQIAEIQQTREIERLSWVSDEAVAAWPHSKMLALIALAQTLAPDQRTSTVARFQASCRDVPRPHTWGEVALVKVRLVAGTWYPQCRVWLKVLCGKL